MSTTAITPTTRTIPLTLTDEPDPKFPYGTRLTLNSGQTGKIAGLEYISEKTRDKEAQYTPCPPDLGWHYTFEYDCPRRNQDPTALFSEAKLVRLTQAELVMVG